MHIADLPSAQVASRHGVQVTTVARTVIDLARTLPFVDGVVVTDAVLAAAKTARGELGAVLAECARWPGVRRAERVIAFSDHRAESALASVARVAFHEHGLPVPKLPPWAGDDEKVIGRADFCWPEHGTIAVADDAARRDRLERSDSPPGRDGRLNAAGFEVVYFTWHEIMTMPWQVVASLRAAFARGGAARDQRAPGRLGPVR